MGPPRTQHRPQSVCQVSGTSFCCFCSPGEYLFGSPVRWFDERIVVAVAAFLHVTYVLISMIASFDDFDDCLIR